LREFLEGFEDAHCEAAKAGDVFRAEAGTDAAAILIVVPVDDVMNACMVGVVLSAFFCNSEEAGVEGPMTASAFLAERQTPKESPHPHRPASMRNLAATTADLTAS
jgi:hypothetical protein